MADTFDVWRGAANLGLFLLGMHLLEQGLQGLGSKSLKQFLQRYTDSPLKGVMAGTGITAFLQSSSLVGLIVLAFVGAGILEMRNALGVILGSNLGTTVTGWMLAVLGFKLDLAVFTEPMVAFGALAMVFLPAGKRPHFFASLLLGLGLLLMGLGALTSSLSLFAEQVDTSILRDQPLWLYVLGGALLTVLVQSSSVVMLLILSALHAGVIAVADALPVMIGANLGTTSTLLLGALGGGPEKHRVAYAHFVFNLVTAVIALAALPLLVYFIRQSLGVEDPLFTLVIFHSLFNLLGIAIFLPFIKPFVELLTRLAPDEQPSEQTTAFIQQVPSNVPDGAIEAVRKELVRLLVNGLRLNMYCFEIHTQAVFDKSAAALTVEPLRHVTVYERDYARLKQTEGELLGYTYAVQQGTTDKDYLRHITQLNHAIRNVAYGAKFIKDIRHNLDQFRHSDTGTVRELHHSFCHYMAASYRGIVNLLGSNLAAEQPAKELLQHYRTQLGEIRRGYEWYLNEIYTVVGPDKHLNHSLSSLLNINRAAYLSNMALLEAVQVLLRIEDYQLAQVETGGGPG